MSMFAQRISQKREAKEQQKLAYEPKPMSLREEDFEDKKMIEERQAQTLWDEKNACINAGPQVGKGVDHVNVRQSWGQNENNRLSRVSSGSELPSYGQAMKQ
ncbi:hypothetical protein EG329_003210 [Mollisiaceae sp. DMI_Dod_QoI]|nr:hypothetical protein EG329_003210 [Helotiales sp. DMI_Dod_QoI]